MEYAIVDVETTGLNKFGNDRIVEVAVIITNSRGAKIGGYHTLINPHRDLGPTHIHGITGQMIEHAPTFEEIADSLAYLLNGRIIVAHNASFDVNFLKQEFTNHNFAADFGTPVDTIAMAKRSYSFTSYTLANICEALDITLVHHHSALADTSATRKLFRQLLSLGNNPTSASETRFSSFAPTISFANWVTREAAQEKVVQELSLESFVATLPTRALVNEQEMPQSVKNEYLTTLHTHVINNEVTVHGRNSLKAYINAMNLTQEQLRSLHENYLTLQMSYLLQEDRRWADKHFEMIRPKTTFLGFTDNQVAVLVRTILQEPEFVKSNSHSYTQLFQLNPNDKLAFSGQVALYNEADWRTYLTAKGYLVGDSVVKATKALVVNDTTSTSSKAVKARNQGTVIITEDTLIQLVGRPY